MSKKNISKRKYNSSRRRTQAFESHSRVIEAARKLFMENGYLGVTIEELSLRTKVSQETIYSVFKNKPTILARAVGLAVGTEGGPVPALLQPYMQEVASERDQHRQIHMFARRMQIFFSQTAPLIEVMRTVAKTEREINSLLKKYLDDRHQGMGFFVDFLLANGPLRNGLNKLTAVETVWVLASAETYNLLVGDRGWSAEEYERWLTESLDRLLLS